MPRLDPTWGPFLNAADARTRLCSFIDRSCGRPVGVVWAANGVVYPIRAPIRDNAGFGTIAAFAWAPAPPPPPRPPHGLWQSLLSALERYGEMEAESQRMQAEGTRMMMASIGRGLDRMIHSHQDDAAGLALDILCVAASIALLPTGVGAAAMLGLVGGVILLGADGIAYAKEIGGDEEGAERFKKRTEMYRIIATVITLPDLAFGGMKAVRELQEVRQLRTVARTTARAAESMAARTARAERATRFAQVAQRAGLRAQNYSRRIMSALRLEIAPRVAAQGAIALLLREEIKGDESALNEVMRRLQVHCASNHR